MGAALRGARATTNHDQAEYCVHTHDAVRCTRFLASFAIVKRGASDIPAQQLTHFGFVSDGADLRIGSIKLAGGSLAPISTANTRRTTQPDDHFCFNQQEIS